MPDIQEFVALGIVALVAGRLLWKRRARRQSAGTSAGRSSDCGDCAAPGPPPKEATVRFYRRRNAEGPASGAPEDEK
jgi:hypothetical protein